jgi:hypothetical protein
MSCNETVANAPVLMPADDTMFITGNEMTDPGFYGIRTQLAIPVFEIGKYTETASELDLKNAESISNALYSLDSGVFSKLKEAELVEQSIPFYDDPALCKQNVQPANNLLYTIQYGGAALAMVVGLVSIPFGGGTTVGVKAGLIAVEFAKAGVVSDASCAIIKARAQNKCTAIDACTHLRFALAADAIFSSLALPYGAGFKGLLSPIYLAGVAGETIAQPLLAGKLEEPSLPYGGSSLANVEGSQFARSSSTTGEFTALPLSSITGAVTARDVAGWLAEVRAITGKSARTAADLDRLENLASALSRAPSNLRPRSVYFDYLQSVLDSGPSSSAIIDVRASADLAGGAAKTSRIKNFFSRFFSTAKDAKTKLKLTPNSLGEGNLALRRYGGLLTRAFGPTIATLVVSYLTSVQSEPVEAVLGERVSNFVVAIHYDKNGDPSSSAYCYYDPSSKACKKEYRMDLRDSLSPDCSASEACLYLTPLKIPYASALPELAGLKTYGLFFAKNQVVEQTDKDYQVLFSSIFDPNAQPDFQGAVDVGILSEVGTPFSYTTADEEQALDEAVILEQAQVLVDSLADNGQTDVLASLKSQGLISSDNQVVDGKETQVVAIATPALDRINEEASQATP